MENERSNEKASDTVKISVIIPVYHSAEYIRKTLQNVLQQTLSPIEILCIDDGSTDGTADAIQEMARKHPNIHYLHQTNAGPGAARNTGIATARGEFVAFLDADDAYPNSKVLEKLYDAAITNRVLIAGGSMEHVYPDGTHRSDFGPELEGDTFTEEGLIRYSDYQYDYAFYRFIYNREFLVSNSLFFPKLRFFEDPVFFVAAMLKADRFYATPDTTYLYTVGHKQYIWKGKEHLVLDLFEGIATNLRVSLQHHLPRLHWYTIAHFNSFYQRAVIAGRGSTRKVQTKVSEVLHLADVSLAEQWAPLQTYSENRLIRQTLSLLQRIKNSIRRWTKHLLNRH